jgi:hypothetical protein
MAEPDETILEGPEGPASHLICGGVYDGSAKWFSLQRKPPLALAPLVMVQSWRWEQGKKFKCFARASLNLLFQKPAAR